MTALTPCQKCKAEREQLRTDNAELTEKCYASARKLIEGNQQTYRAERERDALRTEADRAYTERNRLVAFLARCFPAGVRKTDIPGWDPAWHNCVFIETPEGQMSWHFHDNDAQLFAEMPVYDTPWDGHTTVEKYERLSRLVDATVAPWETVETP